jgi:hypothetical protein
MNTMSTPKNTNSNQKPTKQRYLHQPNIMAPCFSTIEQVGSHHSLVLSITEKKHKLHVGVCVCVCVDMSRAYIYTYIYYVFLRENFQEYMPQNQTDKNLTLTLKSFCSRLFMTIFG